MSAYQKAVVRMNNAVARINREGLLKKLYEEMMEKKNKVGA